MIGQAPVPSEANWSDSASAGIASPAIQKCEAGSVSVSASPHVGQASEGRVERFRAEAVLFVVVSIGKFLALGEGVRSRCEGPGEARCPTGRFGQTRVSETRGPSHSWTAYPTSNQGKPPIKSGS